MERDGLFCAAFLKSLPENEFESFISELPDKPPTPHDFVSVRNKNE